MSISEIIKQHIPVFLQENDIASPYHINCGLCVEFAEEVAVLAGEDAEVMDLYNYSGSDDDPASEYFDARWLAENGYTMPPGVTVEALNRYGEEYGWSHVLVAHDGRYYDAECPEGVDSPFALPLVINNLKSAGFLQDTPL